ncbi:serine/threonine-protein kinase [Streptomyces cavernae]|uniref:serine/threonine-protein kinase n=1 Tax=Streptomyces cavernae TaxID=2259034 RepID=UPI000FEBFD00|nr:serine/threonine-protein kinase [Streptomyces cavernae]
MSNDGGASYRADEPTSFVLHPPRPGAGPVPGNPYAQPVPPPVPGPVPEPVPQPERWTEDHGAGRLIAGRYRLLAKLGHGGMGTVWRAKDEMVDREVAVKEPRVPDHLPERERANAHERMRREARAAARLDHPAVVNVHDVAVVDGRPWIVMELVHGRSLGAALQEGTLDVREAARIGLEVLGALEAAHAAGVLHRDVKPDNVLLGRHDRVVLTDFGIAQIEGETALTDTGGFVGSPEYIAPERVLGQRPGPASDLWSLGVVLYAATEGVSPFRRSNTPATLQSVLNATPAAPAVAQGPLAEAINGLLDKDPARRPNAARVRHLLEEAARPPQETRATQLPVTNGVQGLDPVQGDKAAKGVRLGRKAWLGIGAVVVATALVAAYQQLGNSSEEKLPSGWARHKEADVRATLGLPPGWARSEPNRALDKGHWVAYYEPSYAMSVNLTLYKKSEDGLNEIAGSAIAEAYEDADEMKKTDDSSFSAMAKSPAPKVTTKETSYRGRASAENTVVYSDERTDPKAPRLREARYFYYKTKSGNLYKLWIDYPGKGDFTGPSREIAERVLANLEIHTV